MTTGCLPLVVTLLGVLVTACAPVSPPTAPAHAVAVGGAEGKQAAECRRRGEAENLANQGDQMLLVNVEGAIEKYAQAVTLDPLNHTLLWKLSLADAQRERWDRSALSALRAAHLAPAFATYWHQRAKALLQMAAAGDDEAYEAAREPLTRCIEADRNYAACYYLLGHVEEWSDHAQQAAERYSQAVRLEPKLAEYYLRLGELYVSFRQGAEAEAVLKEGVRLAEIPMNRGDLSRMLVILGQLARERHDARAELDALQHAERFIDEGAPYLAYELGAAYATIEPGNQKTKDKAVRLLVNFSKRVCRSNRAMDYALACEEATTLLYRLVP